MLALRYFRDPLPDNYRPRWGVLRPCSEWKRVVPPRPKHQQKYYSICSLKTEEKSPQVIRSIRTSRLNDLHHFHRLPINPVVYRGSITSPNLGVGFPLRCFQRLSQKNIATRRCYWRNNRHTRDSPLPVLSYWGELSSRLNACTG